MLWQKFATSWLGLGDKTTRFCRVGAAVGWNTAAHDLGFQPCTTHRFALRSLDIFCGILMVSLWPLQRDNKCMRLAVHVQGFYDIVTSHSCRGG